MNIFESTIQKTNLWLKDIEAVLHVEERPKAYAALRAVLHLLRECLPIGESAKFAAQLPLFVTGVYFDGWKARRKPVRLTKDEFFRELRGLLRGQRDLDAGLAARAVFCAIGKHVSPGEVACVQNVLPREVRELWRELTADAPLIAGPVQAPEGQGLHMDFEPIDPMHSWQPGWAARQLGAQSHESGTQD